MAIRYLSNGGQLTERQIETLQDYFTPDELALIVNALREKSKGDYAAAKSMASENLPLMQTLTAQAGKAQSLADALEVAA